MCLGLFRSLELSLPSCQHGCDHRHHACKYLKIDCDRAVHDGGEDRAADDCVDRHENHGDSILESRVFRAELAMRPGGDPNGASPLVQAFLCLTSTPSRRHASRPPIPYNTDHPVPCPPSALRPPRALGPPAQALGPSRAYSFQGAPWATHFKLLPRSCNSTGTPHSRRCNSAWTKRGSIIRDLGAQ